MGTHSYWSAILVFTLVCLYPSLSTSSSVVNIDEGKHTQTSSDKSYHCIGTNHSLPVWSRGLARTCCDIFPQVIDKRYKTRFFKSVTNLEFRSFDMETGSTSDKHYLYHATIQHRSIVYTVISDMHIFLEKFLRLPHDARVVLVTGSEDIGAPVEVFTPNRSTFRPDTIWPQGFKISMSDFLADPRLVKWFAQNYDLTSAQDVSKNVISKVVPIPIGVDFHSRAEKPVYKVTPSMKQQHESVCKQRRELEYVRRMTDPLVLPFHSRPLRILAEFSCDPEAMTDNTVLAGRVSLCKLLQQQQRHRQSSSLIEYVAPARRHRHLQREDVQLAFWRRLKSVSFCFAPAGHGLDTHRVWELLVLNTVPVVLSSSLDSLYLQFPVVIVGEWGDVLRAGWAEAARGELQRRWGAEPFLNTLVTARLSMDYWVSLIRSSIPHSVT